MTLDDFKLMIPTGSSVDVDKLYVELLSNPELTKAELVKKVIHLTLCVEGLGNVIGSLNDVMFSVAAKLNQSSRRVW